MRVIRKIIVMLAIAIGMPVIGILCRQVMATTGILHIEAPSQGTRVKDTVRMVGWAMSDDREDYVQILLDGKIIAGATRQERGDVLKAISGYGGIQKNPKPGFEYLLNTSNVEEGNHILTARTVSSQNRIINSEDISIHVKKYDSMLLVERPMQDQDVKTSVEVVGWALSDEKEDKIIVKVDGKTVGTASRQERGDVLQNIPGFGGIACNPKPGYRLNVDTSNLVDGIHTITIELRAKNNDLMAMSERKIKISKTYQTLFNLEEPIEDALGKASLKVSGWVMSEDKDAIVEILLDDQPVSEKVNRDIRPDVLYAIKGFGGSLTNRTPGFHVNIDMSKTKDGNHTICLNIRSKTGELLGTTTRRIHVKKYDGRIQMEQPIVNQIAKTELTINGWSLSEDKNDKVIIDIDGKKYTEATRYVREDVFPVIPGYGGRETNPTVGYRTSIDPTQLSEGIHNLTVRIESSSGEKIEESKISIVVSRNFDTKIHLEAPQESAMQKREMEIKGWMLSEDAKATLEINIDGKPISETMTRVVRNDVLNAISGYGGKKANPTPGFKTLLDVTGLTDGKHTITVKVLSRFQKVLQQQSVTVMIHKYDARMAVEQPSMNQQVKTSIRVNGWALSEDKEDRIEVRLDQQIVGIATRYLRNDVLNVIAGYGGKETNPLVGYQLDVDLSHIKDGNHTITVNQLTSKTGEILNYIVIPIKVKKYDGMIHIETPIDHKNVKEDTLEVRGWEMSETIATVKLYVDRKDYSNLVTRTQRGDVISAVSGFGGIQTNPTPGFSAIIPVKNLSPGTHTITIKIFSSLGDEIARSDRKIYFFPNALHGMDVSEHNGIIDWDLVKESEIDFAIIRCGYGRDIKEQDDKMFERNLKECERVGIPYGIYLYSYAGDREGARAEAEHVLRLVGNKKPICGIWIDIEDADGYKARNGIPYESGVEVADEFCSIMKARGYQTGIYASLSWLNGPLKNPLLDQYDKWVAQWNNVCEYGGSYVMWQYTSSGAVAGITGNVDMNLWYKKRNG